MSTTTAEVLRASGISKSFRTGMWPRRHTLPVLLDASVTLAPGEVVGLVGENGSGKSTLLRILVGALSADTGVIERSGRIGYCPQEPILYGRLTCNEHLALFGRAYELSDSEIVERSADLYDTLGFDHWADERTDRLSGGTRAKLNLAIAQLGHPDVLLLDEPYAGFDWDTYLRFWDIVAQHKAAGRSVLIISHFVADSERFDRIVSLVDGKTVER